MSGEEDRRRPHDELLIYYEQELTFLRRMLGGFARDYPDKAGMLGIDEDRCVDPHVERLIESVAVLTARTRLKLDASYPLISDSLLGIVQPQLVAPVPPMTIAEFSLDATQDDATEPCQIPRGSYLDSLHAGTTVTCRFRTSQHLDLHPLKVEDVSVVPLSKQELARLGAGAATAAIRIRLRTRAGQPFSALDLSKLSFYLDGKDLAFTLLEDLLVDPRGLVLAWGGWEAGEQRVWLDPSHIRHVGFRDEESLLEYGRGALDGYRLLQEFFCFPHKYLFVEFSGLDTGRATAATDTLDILALVGKPLTHLQSQKLTGLFKLNCVPVINLFEKNADAEVLRQDTVQHHVVPDGRSLGSYEVHSILEVESCPPGSDNYRVYQPFFALGHGDRQADEAAFWHSERLPSLRRGDRGSDVFLTLVDPKLSPRQLEDRDVLMVRGLFFNRDVATKLPFKDPKGDLRIEGKPDVAKILCLLKSTPTLRPSLQEESRWRVVSSLALNHLSLIGTRERPDAGLEAFKEILEAHDFVRSDATRLRRNGLVRMQTRTVMRRLPGRGPARGLEFSLEFDEANYVGSGVFLFASVLERFLAAYTSINSFTQCVARLRDAEGELKRWQPRFGAQA